VVHVIPNLKSALKCAESGVDAIVAEGFEAGGHNGREETTTMALIPLIRKATSLPLIAAGGIGSGSAMLAAFALGAEGVQIGSLFVTSEESSAHPDFKKRIVEAGDGDTALSMKKVVPVRLLRNKFSEEVKQMEEAGATTEELKAFLGHGRAKKGMFEGDMEDGELEIGQVSAMITKILPAEKILKNLMEEFYQRKQEILSLNFE
jgi:enoyl-[acyl-carrier protein] reductase II